MLLPISWLKKYTEMEWSAVEFANGITDSGSHVDSITSLGKPVSGIVVGEVLSIDPHPNADRLRIVRVDIGKGEPLEIVTAATNVKEGFKVPVAVSGAVLADGTEITDTDFRGVTSPGMLCSLEELGIADNVIPKAFADGIYLTKEGTPGEAFENVLGSLDPVLDIEVTPNRPDCLSIIGMARESSATFEKPLHLPSGREKVSVSEIGAYLKDIVLETEDCLRYMGRVIQNVTIEPSPQWMQNSLMQAGMRPINNIVDITNYVMLEMGYPLHAFDIDTVKDKTIVVRHAREGEELLLLNGTTKALIKEDLIIADATDPIGLAGVMGGFDSEITDRTQNILIECAVFDRENIRLGAKRHNLRSEASSRFEKGLSVSMVPAVMDRVCQLAEEIGVGSVVAGSVDRVNYTEESVEAIAEVDRINHLLGTELSAEQMVSFLERLEFEVKIDGGNLIVSVPNFRGDVRIEADIAEEVGRLYGFSNITPQPILGTLSEGGKLPIRNVEDEARKILCGLGFSEALTYSFVSEKGYDLLQLNEDDPLRNSVKLLNPLGEDYSVMRTTLLPNMLHILENNAKNGQDSVMMFELGNTFWPSDTLLPIESRTLSMGVFAEEADFYTIKSAVYTLLQALGITGLSVEECKDLSYLHPGRAAYLFAGDQKIGVFGQISFEVADRIDTSETLYVGEFNFEKIASLYDRSRLYTPINRYPSMKRDLALVVDLAIRAKDVLAVLSTVEEPIIQSIRLFDVYTGSPVPEGKKSMAFQITYQDANQTLKEEDAARVHALLRETAQEKLGAALRQ